MNLETTYLGLRLPHPFITGASPLADDLDTVKRCEDAGAAAITLRSLFEEQIMREQLSTFAQTEQHVDSFAEANTYLPSPDDYILGPENYLDHLRKVKEAVAVPVIASLNGTTRGGWLEYSKLIEDAGADALELNIYQLATDMDTPGSEIEDTIVEMLRDVKTSISIPVAVKLSPFYTSVANMARRLDDAGADGLVLFNRFYQPDIDVEDLSTVRSLHLSDSSELLLRLRWLAVLSGRVKASLAVTGGVHTAIDAVKATMAGADAIQLVSVLLKNGPHRLANIKQDLEEWMEQQEWESLYQMRGNMNLLHCPDPKVYERGNYMLILQSWSVS